ncbi:MAG TPA: SURF1 family protein [Acidimicrobiales bacterium]|nr:SURF1 family protein [Acidimicrobiales bacterium]
MYRFLLRPRWLVGHLLAVALVVLLVCLGLWQLRRHDERRQTNALVASRSEQVVPLPAEGWSKGADASRLSFRKVRLLGRYQADKEVLVRFRSNQGLPGYHVLTPMTTPEGSIIVNRGWVPLELGNRWPDPAARPPAGEIAITGLLRTSQPASRFAPTRPTESAPLSVGAVNVAGLQDRLSMPLYPLYLELDPSTADTAASFPEPLPAPELDEGPHRAYAAQWFFFAAGAAAGWVILARISVRRRQLNDPAERAISPEGRSQGR